MLSARARVEENTVTKKQKARNVIFVTGLYAPSFCGARRRPLGIKYQHLNPKGINDSSLGGSLYVHVLRLLHFPCFWLEAHRQALARRMQVPTGSTRERQKVAHARYRVIFESSPIGDTLRPERNAADLKK